MSTIVTRSGKGSPLTNAEMDANLTNLNTDKLEAAALSPYLTSATAASTYATKINPTTSGTLSHSGDITLTGSGKRITGDFSNATVANRAMFQTSTVNGQSSIGVLPNGTNTSANLNLFGSSDPANASIGQLVNSGTEVRLSAAVTGTGTYLPMTFYTGGLERLRIDTDGTSTFSATSAVKVPTGTTAQRPAGSAGQFRYNSTLNRFEGYNGSAWTSLVPADLTTSSGLTMNTAKLLGRSTASIGAVEEITIGTGLSLTEGQLSCNVTSPVTSVFGRTGAVTLASSDVTTALGFTPMSKDVGSGNVGAIAMGYDNTGVGTSAGGTTASFSSFAITISTTWSAPVATAMAGTWRALQNVPVAKQGIFQRIA